MRLADFAILSGGADGLGDAEDGAESFVYGFGGREGFVDFWVQEDQVAARAIKFRVLASDAALHVGEVVFGAHWTGFAIRLLHRNLAHGG
jgi:hypothetical protein